MPQSSGIPQLPSVPRETSHGENPISYGSRAAMEAVRQSIGNRTGDTERALGRLASNVARGLYAKSGSAFGQQMAQIQYDPYADEDAQLKENLEVLDFIKRSEHAQAMLEKEQQHRNQQYLMHQQSLAEQERHHRAAEGAQHALHAYEIENAKEAALIAKRIKEETGDHVQPMAAMKPAMQQYANKQTDQYIEITNAAAEGLQTTERMKEIAISNPSILNNWNFVVANMYNQHPGFWQQAALNLKVSKKDRDAFFEMASLAKNLNIAGVKKIPARGLNQMLERELFSANPNARMSQGALLKVLDKTKEGLEHSYTEYGKAARYGRDGYLYKPMTKMANSKAPTAEQHQELADIESPGATSPGLESLTDEQINQMLGGG